MRWIMATLGVLVGLPTGLIVGGVPIAMIFVALNRNIDYTNIDSFFGLTLTLKIIVVIAIFSAMFIGGILGGLLGYRLERKLRSQSQS